MGGCGSTFATKFQLSENLAIGVTLDFTNPKHAVLAQKIIAMSADIDKYDPQSQKEIQMGLKQVQTACDHAARLSSP